MYTISEAAARLGLAHRTILSAIERGKLPRRPHPARRNRLTKWMLTDDDLERYARESQGRVGRPPHFLTHCR